MSSKQRKKNEENLDLEEDETIALSTDELDDILSEAEIVQEKPAKKGHKKAAKAPETVEDEIDIPVTEEEFDISGEIDELTPEDLENIELEESEIESFSKELEEELGEEIKLPEESLEEEVEVVTDEELGEELESIDMDELSLESDEESSNEQVVDIDALLESEGEGIDLESLDLGEEASEEEVSEEELEEPPTLVEEEAGVSLEADEAFKEAGIEGIEDESVSLDEIDLEGIEEISAEVELPSEGEEAGELSLEDLAEVELVGEEAAEEGLGAGESIEDLETIEELGTEESLEDLGELEELGTGESLEDLGEIEELGTGESLEDLGELEELGAEEFAEVSAVDEVELSDEDEKILSEDFDLTAGVDEEEDVVTVTGEELEALGEGEPDAISRAGGSVVDAALLNDITTILKFMDTLLGDLPEEKIKEFAQSEYFPLYKEVFDKLNLT
jgi:pilus assembly protein FimV